MNFILHIFEEQYKLKKQIFDSVLQINNEIYKKKNEQKKY